MGLGGAAAILPPTRQQQHEQLFGRWRIGPIAQREGSPPAGQSSHEVNHSKSQSNILAIIRTQMMVEIDGRDPDEWGMNVS